MTRFRQVGLLCLLSAFSLFASFPRANAQELPAQNLPQADDGEKVVALCPFTGAEAAVPPKKPLSSEATARVVRDILTEHARTRFRVISATDYTQMARKRFGGKTTQLQGIAKALNADLVVGGWMEAVGPDVAQAGKPYKLTLALYNNWAEPLGQVALDMDSQRIDAGRLKDLAGPFFLMIEQNLGLIPKPEEAQKPPTIHQADDREQAPLVSKVGPKVDKNAPLIPPSEEAKELYYTRPPWRPVFEASAGYLANIRHFTDNGSGRAFNTSAGHGVRAHGELYPLAGLENVPLAAAGLGVRLTFLLPFWKEVRLLNEMGDQMGSYSASEYRVEVGYLRWHYNPWNAVLRPELEVEALYGYHRFDFAPGQNVLTLDIPSVAYSYMGAYLGTRMYLARRFSTRLGFAFAGMLDLGPIAEPGAPGDDPRQAGRAYHVYGPGSGWLWRMDLSFALRIVAGVTLGLGCYYEQKKLSFEGTGDVLLRDQVPGAPPQKVTSATDEFGGIFLSLGYVY